MSTPQRRKFSFKIYPKLVEYLKQRADTNFRDADGELNAILTTLQAQGSQDPSEAREASVTPLFPVEGNSAAKGPLDTQSGYRGVYPYGKRWMAAVQEDGSRKRLGVFDTPKQAALIYDDYVREVSFGASAVNFPQTDEQGIEDPNNPVSTLDEETRRMIDNGPMQSNGALVIPDLSFEDPSANIVRPSRGGTPPPGVVRVPRDDAPSDST